MNFNRHGLRRVSRAAFSAAVIASLIAATSLSKAASAMPDKVIALAFDAGTNTVIGADARRLYRLSDDSGDREVLALPNSAKQGSISAVAVSARAPHILYVAGPRLGVLRSSDGGRTWIAKREGLPSADIRTLAVHADQPKTVYVYVGGKGIFRSEDAGDHWRLMDRGPREPILQFVHSNMPGSMQTGWLFAATEKGIARSMDCFCGWRDAGALGRSVTAVAFDPQQPKRVYAATRDGLLMTENGGEQWSDLHAPGRIIALVATPRGDLFVADESGVLFRSGDHGRTWHAIGG